LIEFRRVYSVPESVNVTCIRKLQEDRLDAEREHVGIVIAGGALYEIYGRPQQTISGLSRLHFPAD
jgi:hypothetical protein